MLATLDRKTLDYLHREMQSYGLWLRQGRASPGQFTLSVWPGTRKKPLKRRRQATRLRKDKLLVKPTQPHSTRTVSARLLKLPRFRTDRYEKAHKIVLTLPDIITKRVVVCLYIRGHGFPDTARILDLTGKEVGEHRFNALEAVANVL